MCNGSQRRLNDKAVIRKECVGEIGEHKRRSVNMVIRIQKVYLYIFSRVTAASMTTDRSKA